MCAMRFDLKHPDGTWLSPQEIKEKFALPSLPTHYSTVTPPAGTPFYMGIAAKNDFGPGGGIQIQAGVRPLEDWFGAPVPLASTVGVGGAK